MTAADRHKLLEQTYSVTKGYGVSYARISIGCNDFSSTESTRCDDTGTGQLRFCSRMKRIMSSPY